MTDTTRDHVDQLPEVELGSDGLPGEPIGTAAPASDIDLDRISDTLDGDPELERQGVSFSPTALVVQLTGQFVLGSPSQKPGGAPLSPEDRARGFAEFCGGLLQALDFDGAVKHCLERSGLGREVRPGIVLALGAGVVLVGAMLYREKKPKAAPVAAARPTQPAPEPQKAAA